MNSLGYEETMRCSDYKASCSASGFARPIPVQDGYKCFNGQEIEVSLCSLTAATPCTFGGTPDVVTVLARLSTMRVPASWSLFLF